MPSEVGTSEPVPRWSSNVLVFDLPGGGRACIRPSGTEPKVKFYLEVAETVGAGEDPAAARARGEATLQALRGRLFEVAGLA